MYVVQHTLEKAKLYNMLYEAYYTLKFDPIFQPWLYGTILTILPIFFEIDHCTISM